MALNPIEILINARDNASGVFDRLNNKLKVIGVAIVGYFGVQAFAGIVEGAADFEQAMSRVQSATGASAEEMERLKKAAEDAGANTKYTSTEAAAALENLAKAGLTAGDAIEALPAVLALAEAGDVDLATSAEYVTKAVMGMGLAFTDAGRVADVLALGANSTNTSVKGLAEALSYAAPTAQTLGLSLESTVAIIGKFADAGIDASRAGTALNSIMSQFSDPASKFKSELGAIGITTVDFSKALHELAASGGRGSKAINAVGMEAGPALKALLNQGMPALDALKAKLDGAAGSAAETARVMGDNLRGSIGGLSSAWETVKNVLGTPVLPVLKDGVDKLAAAFRAAVADGTVQRFGEAIAAAFQSGITWIKAFAAEVDFTKLAADLRAFADRTGEVFAQMGEYATNAGSVVKAAYGTMQASGNTLLTGLYGTATGLTLVIQGVLKGLELLYLASSKVTFGDMSKQYAKIAADLKIHSDGMGAAVAALGVRVRESLSGVGKGLATATEGFKGLGASATGANPAMDAAAAAAAAAAEQTAKINAAIAAMRTEYDALVAEGNLDAAAAKTRQIDAAVASLAATLPTATAEQKKKNETDRLAAIAAGESSAAVTKLRAEYAALVAAGDMDAAAKKQREIEAAVKSLLPALPALTAEQKKKAESDKATALAAEEHRAALAKLRAEYAALIASGDVQGAAQKLQEINKALRETPAAAKASADAIAAVESAFRGLGVASSADLKTLAETARKQYEIIKNAGTSTAQDIGNAFASYATKAIAANGGVADAAIKAEAAMRGYKIEVDAAGQHSVKLATSVSGAAQAMKVLGIDAGAVSSKMSAGFKESGAAVDALSKDFGEMAKQGVNAAEAITLGLNKLMSEAKNQADIDALTAKIQSLRGVLGDKITDGFLEQAKEAGKKLKETMDAATPGINSVAEAMKTLGIKSEEELDGMAAKAKEAFDVIKNSGTASPREIAEAWKAMAEAAIAANGGVADSTIKAQASAHGFAIEVDEAGKASVKSLGDVEEGFESIDYAAQMAGKSVKELSAAMNDWRGGKDMADSAAKANAAANEIANAWRSAAVEADQYYSELYDIYKLDAEFVMQSPWKLDAAIWKASAALKELDKQQQAVERSSDDAASGLASLEDKLLELSGSEEEVAARRKARDQAEIKKKMALLEIDLQRAQIRKNDEEVAQLDAELQLYRQQLVLIDQIAQKEKEQRDEAKRKQEEEDKARKAQAEQDERDRKAQQDKADQDRKLQQQKADQDRGGRGGGSGGSASITAAPPPPASHTYVSNVNIPGIGSASLKFADASSQSQTEDLLRKLAQAKGAAIR